MRIRRNACVLILITSMAWLFVVAQARKTPRTAGAPNAPRLKGVFEPANYAEDVQLNDVFFVDDKTGWAVGQGGSNGGGFIIATRDAGHTWNVQLGDPHSASPAVAQIFMLDATHGWATQWNEPRLLRTTDGESWQPAGNIDTLAPFTFISPDRGFFLSDHFIEASDDGGATWKHAFECRVKVEVQGLPHEQGCQPAILQFAPDHQTGYMISRALDDKSSAVVKTSDGGQTWSVCCFIKNFDGKDGSLALTAADAGFVRAFGITGYYETRMTRDGGQSWTAVAATAPGGLPKIIFQQPVGWMAHGNEFAYTTDGGKRWLAGRASLPTAINAFSLASAERAYVVGSHGMIYRYHVVPVTYTPPKNAVVAPVMALPEKTP